MKKVILFFAVAVIALGVNAQTSTTSKPADKKAATSKPADKKSDAKPAAKSTDKKDAKPAAKPADKK